MKYTYNNIISFFKENNLYNEDEFNLINKSIKRMPFNKDKEYMFKIYPNIDNNGILKDFIIVLPQITDEQTYLINKKYYIQALELIKFLDKPFKQSILFFKDNNKENKIK